MVFNQLDIDKDGELNEDEFVKGCLKVCFVQKNELLIEKNCSPYYRFQDSALQDLLNGSAEWYKSTIWMSGRDKWDLFVMELPPNDSKDDFEAVI